MFVDDSSTIVSDKKHVKVAIECIHSHGKETPSKQHEGKTIVMTIGKVRSEKITESNTKENFKTLLEVEIETCLGDVIGKVVTKENEHEKSLNGIE